MWKRQNLAVYVVAILVLAVVGNIVFQGGARKKGIEAASINDYWDWRRGLLPESGKEDIEGAFILIEANPSLHAFYIPLATLCRKLGAMSRCYTRMRAIRVQADNDGYPAYSLALSRLVADNEKSLASIFARRAALSSNLTTSIARHLADDAIANRSGLDRDQLREAWSNAVEEEEDLHGQIFGLAYLDVLEQDWTRAETALLDLADELPLDAEVYRELGRIYFTLGNREKCYEVTMKAVEVARKARDLDGELTAMGNLVYLDMRWGGSDVSIETRLLRIIGLAERTGSASALGASFYRLGALYAGQLKYKEALDILETANSYSAYVNAHTQTEIHATRAEIYRRLFKFDRAIDELTIAITIAQAASLTVVEMTSTSYVVQLLRTKGHLEEALALSLESIHRADSISVADMQIMFRKHAADIYRDLYMYDDSIELYTQALSTAKLTQATTRQIGILYQLGLFQIELRHFDVAKELLNEAIDLAGSNSDSLLMQEAIVGIATIWHEAGYNDTAIEYLDKAESSIEDKASSSAYSDILIMRGVIEHRSGNIETALRTLDQAGKRDLDLRQAYLHAIARAEVSLDTGQFERALEYLALPHHALSDLSAHPELWQLNLGRAVALWKLKRHDEAGNVFESLVTEVERRRDLQAGDRGRTLIASSHHEVFETYATYLSEAGRIREAILIGEMGRSRALGDLLYATQSARGRDDGSFVERAINARTRFRGLASDNISLTNQVLPDSLLRVQSRHRMGEIRNLDVFLGQLEGELTRQEPHYRYAPIGASEIQGILDQNEAVLLYSVATKAIGNESAAMVFVVKRDTVEVVQLDLQGVNLEETVSLFREELVHPEREKDVAWKSYASRLYKLLVDPVMSVIGPDMTHLHIIPEGPLHHLPFASLLDTNGRYLVQRYSLSYAPSLTVLKLSRDANPVTWASVLLIADPDGTLPGARHEVQLIASKAPDLRQVLLGENATVENISGAVSDYDIIHFATHGSFKARQPTSSHLQLFDDVLSVDEIGKLDLDAYLVTLSACETALSGGVIEDRALGEEWIGLYQAFLAAGTPTVMASLWAIHDRYSGPLMSRFYEQLESRGKADALAIVQRSFIDNPTTSHPYYWAAFSVLGDPR